jgi:oligopeptide/dipeptide ABC transporter ATP-binding protein
LNGDYFNLKEVVYFVMIALIVRRFIQLILLLIGISFLVFTSMHIAPGDPAAIIGGPTATESDIAAIRENLGLNDPFLVQYWNYLKGILQGDLGYSYQTKQSVAEAIAIRFPNTLNLAIASMIVAVVIGVLAGIISALKQNSWLDVTSTVFALAGISAPTKQLYENPLHPYTRALLSTIPRPKVGRNHQRIHLLGEIPNPANPPSGCAFHTRCPLATEVCKQVKPEWRNKGNNHFVACHHVEKGSELS